MRLLTSGALIGALTILCACAPTAPTANSGLEEQRSSRASTSSPRLPRGVVHLQKPRDVLVSAPGTAQCRTTSQAQAAAALNRTNAMRAARGKMPLRTNSKLQRAAEAHACDMAQRGMLTHRGRSSSGPAARAKQHGYAPRITAENIGAGRFDLARVQTEWARSPSHAANLFHDGMRDFGIGHAVAADGKSTFWAAVYAADR